MKKLYALTALLLGMMGCSEETITYTNPVPGDEPSGIAAELGISSKNTWFAAEDERNASIGFKSLGGEVVVDIQTNTTWKYDAVNAGWLTIEKDDVADQLVLNCEGNKVEEQQQATITITAGDKTATISATQNAYGTLEIAASKNNFQIPAVGELTAEFEVQSTDEDWIFETKDCPWLLLEQQGDKVTMTLDPNEEIEDRETTFVLHEFQRILDDPPDAVQSAQLHVLARPGDHLLHRIDMRRIRPCGTCRETRPARIGKEVQHARRDATPRAGGRVPVPARSGA